MNANELLKEYAEVWVRVGALQERIEKELVGKMVRPVNDNAVEHINAVKDDQLPDIDINSTLQVSGVTIGDDDGIMLWFNRGNINTEWWTWSEYFQFVEEEE
jgi:hypothetical protein